jgi:hypothetical protein
MSNETETLLLKAVLEQYSIPDPKIVGTITKNGIDLAYVSHSDITRILIEIDPMWNWSPIAWDNGRPSIHEANGVATMWATLTLLGKSLIGVGSAQTAIITKSGEKYPKPDYEKELVGDFLRNGAMRFGICLSLWSKHDWGSSDKTEVRVNTSSHPSQSGLSDNQIEKQFTTKPVTKIGALISDKQKGLALSLAKETANGNIDNILRDMFNKTNISTLTTKEGSDLIKHLMNLRQNEQEPEQPF